jgi:hypothetical protein
VCAGYAELFDRMGGAAGLTVRRIPGIAKGYGYDRDGVLDSTPNHDWNAVRLGGRWQLVDVTWDSGYLAGSGTFKKEYRTDYLFLEPGAFLYTHFPVDPADQLLPRPASFKEYAEMPWLRGEFFRYGLRLLTPGVGFLARTDTALRIELACPEDAVVDGGVEDAQGNRIACAAFVAREKGSLSVIFSVPGPGTYKCNIYARRGGEPFTASTWVCAFKTRFSRGTGTEAPFPLIYTGYYDAGGQLLGPLEGVLQKGARQEFRISAPGAAVVALHDGKKMLPFQKGEDGIFSLACRVPDIPELIVYSQLPNGKYQGMVRYLVRARGQAAP